MPDVSRSFEQTLKQSDSYFLTKKGATGQSDSIHERNVYFDTDRTHPLGKGTGNPCVTLKTQNVSRRIGFIDHHRIDRYLVAEKDFKVGDIVLISTPAVHPVVQAHKKDKVCSYCFNLSTFGQRHFGTTEPGKISRCSRCQYMSYCSKECQQADWKHHHKIECSAIPIIQKELPGERIEQVLLCGRVLRQCENRVDMKSSDFSNIVSPWSMILHEDLKNDAKKRFPLVHATLLKANLLKSSEDTVDMVSKMMQRFDANNFSVTGPEFSAVAEGIFPVGALVNHHCRPNVIPSYALSSMHRRVDQGVALIFRCVEPIAKGDEIQHCYTNMLLPPWERKLQLELVYRFRCGCVYCRSTPDEPPELSMKEAKSLEVANKVVANALETGFAVNETQKLSEACVLYKRIFGFYDKAVDAVQAKLALAFKFEDLDVAVDAASELVSNTHDRLGLHPLTAAHLEILASLQMILTGHSTDYHLASQMAAIYIYVVSLGKDSRPAQEATVRFEEMRKLFGEAFYC